MVRLVAITSAQTSRRMIDEVVFVYVWAAPGAGTSQSIQQCPDSAWRADT